MTALAVVTAGSATTLQDGGRPGHLRHGVPRSGPVDALAHRLAAELAGRSPDEVAATVALEVGAGTCRLRARQGDVDLAVAGAGAAVELGGHVVATPCVVRVPAEQVVAVTAGTWTYVVPAGDLDVRPVLGSASRHPRSGIGPGVVDGSLLPIVGGRLVRRGSWPVPGPVSGPLGLLAAPQTDWFTAAALRRLVTEGFTTTHHADRMGARLDGPVLESRRGHDVVSDGIVPGTLQVDGDGRVSVLLADHQSTGGYPKIGVLGAAALARFVRLPPGRPVSFAWTDAEAAAASWRAALAYVDQVVTTSPRPTAVALANADLTSDEARGGP